MNAPAPGPDSSFASSPDERLRNLAVAPLLSLDKDQVQTYFQQMYSHDTLKYRLSDVVEPTWSDVLDVIKRIGKQMFMVVDQNSDDILGEFTLENATGHAVQGHFSTHPTLSWPERLEIGRFALRFILKNPYIDAVFGLTPLTNRPACIYALKIGFKKQGILHHGMLVNSVPEDCMISVAHNG